MILASETCLDCSRALEREKKEGMRQVGRKYSCLVADVIDNNGLVSKDVFVFGGHSTRASCKFRCKVGVVCPGQLYLRRVYTVARVSPYQFSMLPLKLITCFIFFICSVRSHIFFYRPYSHATIAPLRRCTQQKMGSHQFL